jgi:hypothetical protein
VALLVAIGLGWIVEPLLGLALQALDVGEVARFFPTAATTAIVQPPQVQGGPSLEYLPWWGGILVLLAYAAVSAGIGAALTLRRDIT